MRCTSYHNHSSGLQATSVSAGPTGVKLFLKVEVGGGYCSQNEWSKEYICRMQNKLQHYEVRVSTASEILFLFFIWAITVSSALTITI